MTPFFKINIAKELIDQLTRCQPDKQDGQKQGNISAAQQIEDHVPEGDQGETDADRGNADK